VGYIWLLHAVYLYQASGDYDPTPWTPLGTSSCTYIPSFKTLDKPLPTSLTSRNLERLSFYRATLCIAHLSHRKSVCPSVTLVDCTHVVRPTIMISSPHGSPMILSFPAPNFVSTSQQHDLQIQGQLR